VTNDLFHSMNETATLRATNVSRSVCDARSAVGARTAAMVEVIRHPSTGSCFGETQHTNIRWIDLDGL